MAIITKIEEQKNKARVNIFVDDAFFCGLNKETAIIFGLKKGIEIDENKLNLAIFESEVKSAFEKAVDYTTRRMHAEKELYLKLIKKGYLDIVANAAIEKLKYYHYIDDELFSKQFVEQNSRLSKIFLKEKLKQKGVSQNIIEKVISNRDDDQEFELCFCQAKKYIKNKKISSFEDKQKLYASLARKGFNFDLIKKVCSKLLREIGEEEIDIFE